MSRPRRAAVSFLLLTALVGLERPGLSEPSDAKIWVGRHQEIQEYLRTAECETLSPLGPSRTALCNLPPGGPVARLSWKPIPSGIYRGFRESYKAEIAAYEMDKLLALDMVPPTVERHFDGIGGAAQLWVENIVGMKDGVLPETATRAAWEMQLARMAMFDDLIGLRARSLQSTLRDASWQLILIDHSTAFPANSELPRKLTKVDRALWDRMEKLTRAELDAALKPWLDEAAISALVERRERLRAEILRLPKG